MRKRTGILCSLGCRITELQTRRYEEIPIGTYFVELALGLDQIKYIIIVLSLSKH